MRRLAFLTVLIALALAPAAQAFDTRVVSGTTDRLQLYNGRGVAKLFSADGVAWGQLGIGRITVTDLGRDRGVTDVRVSGHEQIRRPARGVTTYINTSGGMSFSVVDGRWRLAIRGGKIYGNAVLDGSAVLSQGRAGTYRVNFGPRRAWPFAAKTVIS